MNHIVSSITGFVKKIGYTTSVMYALGLMFAFASITQGYVVDLIGPIAIGYMIIGFIALALLAHYYELKAFGETEHTEHIIVNMADPWPFDEEGNWIGFENNVLDDLDDHDDHDLPNFEIIDEYGLNNKASMDAAIASYRILSEEEIISQYTRF